MQQAGGTEIAGRETHSAGRLAKGRSEERLAYTRGSEDKQIKLAGNPVALGQFENKAAVQAASGRQVEVFEAGRKGEVGNFDAGVRGGDRCGGLSRGRPGWQGVLRRRDRCIWGCGAALPGLPGKQAGAAG